MFSLCVTPLTLDSLRVTYPLLCVIPDNFTRKKGDFLGVKGLIIGKILVINKEKHPLRKLIFLHNVLHSLICLKVCTCTLKK